MALGPGGWHTEYHMGVRPHTTVGRRRCVPNTPADAQQHAQPHARRSVPVPTTIPQPVPYHPQPEERPSRAAEAVPWALCTARYVLRASAGALVARCGSDGYRTAPIGSCRHSKLAPLCQPARLYQKARLRLCSWIITIRVQRTRYGDICELPAY